MPSAAINAAHARLLALLDPAYHGDGALLGGFAVVVVVVEGVITTLHDHGLWGSATAPWIDLHALGMDLRRAPGESTDALVARMRTTPAQLTRAAVQSASTDAAAELGADAPVVLEHWRDGAFLESAYLATDRPLQTNAGFSVLVDDILGDVFDRRYDTIVWAVEGVRAHGARWFLFFDTE